jgi:signal peptidase I
VEIRRLRGCLLEIVQTLVLTLVVFLVLQNFVAQPYRVELRSMQPTLEPGHHLLVDKLTPRFDAYDRGDVIVFRPPERWFRGNDTAFVKRVIGVAGETVELRDDGFVYVDGRKLVEPYVFTVGGLPELTEPRGGQNRWLIPDGELFVLGDHRRASDDSRVFGPIESSSVVGRAWVRYWPPDAFGFLGDREVDDAR